MQTANSWTRAGTTNNFLANGGTELNPVTQVYDLDFRNYDPALGRLNQVDPMADKYSSLSPYHYSFNNPARFNDPSGLEPGGSIAYGTYRPGPQWVAGDQARDIGGGGGGGGNWYKVTTTYLERTGLQDEYGNFIRGETDYRLIFETEYVYGGETQVGVGRLNFADLWANYGSGLSHLHPKTKEELFPNYCAINLSESLIKNGLSPDGTKCWGNCSSNQSHTIRAQELADWLKDNLSGVKNITGKDFMSKISGRTGIVFFQNYYEGEEESMTGDHIDLWNKNQMGTYGSTQTWIRTNIPWLGQMMGMSDLRNSTQILFWEIK